MRPKNARERLKIRPGLRHRTQPFYVFARRVAVPVVLVRRRWRTGGLTAPTVTKFTLNSICACELSGSLQPPMIHTSIRRHSAVHRAAIKAIRAGGPCQRLARLRPANASMPEKPAANQAAADGEYRVASWNKTPLRCHAAHPDNDAGRREPRQTPRASSSMMSGSKAAPRT